MESLEVIYLVLFLVFLLVCAFFSSAEIGFIKLQRIRLKHLQEEGVHGADRVGRIMEHPEKFLSTVLTGISFAETIVVSLGTIFIVALLGEGLGTPIAIVLIAIILLIFAKVIPKTIAAQHPERIATLRQGNRVANEFAPSHSNRVELDYSGDYACHSFKHYPQGANKHRGNRYHNLNG